MKDNVNNRFDDFRQLDDMFRQGLENLRPEPSKDLWKGINRKLWWDEISHFTFTNLSKALWIGGIVGMMMIVTALMVVVVPQPASQDNTSFTILTDHPYRNSHVAYFPENYTSDQTNAVSTFLSDEHISGKSAEEEYLPVTVNISYATDETDIQSMSSLPIPYSVYETSSADPLYLLPEIIQNTALPKSFVPKFFSLDFGITPEVSLSGNNSSETEMNFAGNAGISYHIGRFSLRTGLGLSYMSDDGIYKVEYVSKDSVGFYNMVTSVAINQQDPKEIIYFTHRIVVYDSIEHIADDRTRNRYTYLRIPLLAGFRILETNRLGLTIQAGPMISFLIREKEAQPVIDFPNARIIRIDNNTPSRMTTNWQIQIGLKMDFKVNKNFSLYAEPKYQYYFNPVTQQETNSSRHPYSIGLGIGIEYNFGRK